MIKTSFFLEGQEVDLDSDVVIPLNYAIADVRNPESKNSNFSKTISLPGTVNNNEIFSFLFNTSVTVNSSGTYQYDLGFDPNLKSECVILYEGAEIFRGYLELNKIVKIDDYQVRYEVTCTGNLVNLFFSVGEKFLSDIDLSEYNHPYTYHVQKASWNNYIYKNGSTQAFTYGDGYVYPYIDYGTNNDSDWKVTDFKPAVYAYTIMKKIFETEGFTWTSSFLESSLFKKLIIPYTQGNLNLSNTEILDKTFQASSNADQVCKHTVCSTFVGQNVCAQQFNIAFQNDSTGGNFDPGGVFNTTTYRFTVPDNNQYNLTVRGNIKGAIFRTPATYTLGTLQPILVGQIDIVKVHFGTTYLVSLPVYIHAANATNLQANAINISTGYNHNAAIPSGTYFNLGSYTYFECNVNAYLNQGDDVWAIFTVINNSLQTGFSLSANDYLTFTFESGLKFKATLANVSLVEGANVDMSNVLPNQVKQKDFISSIIKMFNLYVDQDKSKSNNFIIEPRDAFYASSGVTRDWTYKLDMSRDLEIIPMGELDAKTYHWTYKDDADYYNQKYKKDYGYNYGHKLYSVRNDHRKNERKTEVIFSPTPIADRNMNDRVVPRIFELTTAGGIQPKTGNIRILYYGGVKTTTFGWNYYTTSGGALLQTTYPYSGHLDDVSYPTLDLSFGMPIEVYYTATAYTDGNLFNRYWKKMIDEITDKDSKIIRGYFHLDPLDINRLDFRDIYYFERDYYRLNKIIDYNPAEVKPTLCEFLKIKESPSFSPTSGTITGGNTDTGIGLDGAVVYNPFADQFNNQRTGQLQSGIENIIDPSARGIIVTGQNNFVGYTNGASILASSGVTIYPNSYNVNVIGSSGVTVYPGTTNATVINTFDTSITSENSNQTIIDGVINGYMGIGYHVDTYFMKATDSGKFLIFELGANTPTYLPSPDVISAGWTIEVKNDNNGGINLTVTITAGTTTPVWSKGDGTTATTHVLGDGDSYKYTYYDNTWYIR